MVHATPQLLPPPAACSAPSCKTATERLKLNLQRQLQDILLKKMKPSAGENPVRPSSRPRHEQDSYARCVWKFARPKGFCGLLTQQFSKSLRSQGSCRPCTIGETGQVLQVSQKLSGLIFPSPSKATSLQRTSNIGFSTHHSTPKSQLSRNKQGLEFLVNVILFPGSIRDPFGTIRLIYGIYLSLYLSLHYLPIHDTCRYIRQNEKERESVSKSEA